MSISSGLRSTTPNACRWFRPLFLGRMAVDWCRTKSLSGLSFPGAYEQSPGTSAFKWWCPSFRVLSPSLDEANNQAYTHTPLVALVYQFQISRVETYGHVNTISQSYQITLILSIDSPLILRSRRSPCRAPQERASGKRMSIIFIFTFPFIS
jgi:hypothetical protein